MSRKYVKAVTAFCEGPIGSGWSIYLLDEDNNGPGVTLHYHKLGGPNKTLQEEPLSIHDLKRIRNFCDEAIRALSTGKLEGNA